MRAKPFITAKYHLYLYSKCVIQPFNLVFRISKPMHDFKHTFSLHLYRNFMYLQHIQNMLFILFTSALRIFMVAL